MPVSMVKRRWWAISFPWSQVMDRVRWSGRVVMALFMASLTFSALRPSGRWRSIRYLVERSTRVPTADLRFLPMIRSPGHGPVGNLGRPFRDHDHAGDDTRCG